LPASGSRSKFEGDRGRKGKKFDADSSGSRIQVLCTTHGVRAILISHQDWFKEEGKEKKKKGPSN